MFPSPANASQVEYGRRLIPTLVDELAQTTPDQIFALIPRSETFVDGLEDVTVSDFARAVNRAAFWIESKLGKSASFETIAYLGPTDLRYFTLALGAAKVGYKILLPSPRNSIEGHLSLLEITKCQALLSPTETKVDNILAKRSMHSLAVGALEEWLAKDPVAYYPYGKTFDTGSRDPFIIIHTSGSTGLPKPITICQGSLTTIDSQHLLPPLDGYNPQVMISHDPVRLFTSLPPFHMGGIMDALAIALYYEEAIIWPVPSRPISVDMVDDLLDNTTVNNCMIAPSILEEMSQSQSSLEKLKKLNFCKTGGGPLSKSAGDQVAEYTHILNVMGSSESCMSPVFHKDPEDWVYFHFDPKMKGIEFREIDDGIYEQFYVRHPSTDPYHSLWYTFPEKSEISTSDLFSKHPSKPDLWSYRGRSDDMIVFSNGEKFNPNAMEATLCSHPEVRGAVVVGQARFQPAALLELKGKAPDSDQAKKEFLDSLAPYIEKSNERAPAFAKLQRDHVAFTKPEKPMVRADKGTIKRVATSKEYAGEIDKLYADAEESSGSTGAVQLDAGNLDSLKKALPEVLLETVGLHDITPDQDIFNAGADSLQVMNLVRQLRASLTAQAHLISPRIVYSNPTPSKLAEALHELTNPVKEANENLDKERISRMEEMLAKYSRDLPTGTTNAVRPKEATLTIVLTGSTGSLGSYLLDSLMASPRVSKVICLNRGAHGEDKQKNVNASRGLLHDWGDKVVFLTTDLSKDRLGLNHRDYGLLVREASFIIHNQWQVDFNLSLESFEPHIAGVRDFINLSNHAPKKPPILFTSSISTLGYWPVKHPGEKVPEQPIHDFSIPMAMGYGESKYVAERLLELAAQSSGVCAGICRVGQLAGPVKKGGMWSKQEWLPSLIASSKYLGKIPKRIPSQDTVPWVPVDATAHVIVELALSDVEEHSSSEAHAWTRYHNLVNPRGGKWDALVPAIVKTLGGHIEPVEFDTWLEALQATASKTEDVAKNPGIKLLEWFDQMRSGGEEAELETIETEKRSDTLRGLSAVGPEWMEIWLKQWNF